MEPAKAAAPLAVLLVEDSPADARLLQEGMRESLTAGELTLMIVRTLADAQRELRRFEFSCVLLDLGLPDGQGAANIEAVRRADRRPAVVILTGLDSEDAARDAVTLGAQDYLVKGEYDGAHLLRILRRAVQRHRQVADLEDRHQEQFIAASFDALTGLANRQLFDDRVRTVLAQTRRAGRRAAICYIDLDGFKGVNDRYGHAIGDELLRRVGRILLESVRDTDTVARLGGDEFVILLVPADQPYEPENIAQRVFDRLNAVRSVEGCTVNVSCSIGIAVGPDDGDSPQDLIGRADEAMYVSKRRGGGVVRFARSSTVEVASDPPPVAKVEDVLDTDEFTLYYQPWIDARQRRFAGVEILLRMRSGERLVRPEAFMASVEASGRAPDIARGVARRACAQWKLWAAMGVDVGQLAFNVGIAELQDTDYLTTLVGYATAAGMSPSQVQLDIQPGVLTQHAGALAAQLRRFREHGFSLALDRFSPDTHPLGLLSITALDGVKLERRVMRLLAEEGLTGPARRALVAVTGAADALSMQLTITGVESEKDFDLLGMVGARYMQGLWLADAMPATEIPGRWRQGLRLETA